MIRRFFTVLVLAMWMGGFTFYAEIVIPTAAKVLGSERQVGFVTERVTHWLNLIGLAALAVFLWNLWAEWRDKNSRWRRILAVAWGVMLLAHAGLFAVHPMIEKELDLGAHKVRNFDQFEMLHMVYLVFATIQWAAALTYMWFSLASWRHADQQKFAPSASPAESDPREQTAGQKSAALRR